MTVTHEFGWLTGRLSDDRATLRPRDPRLHAIHSAAAAAGWLRFAGTATAIVCPQSGEIAPVRFLSGERATLGSPSAETVSADDVKLWRVALEDVRSMITTTLEVTGRQAVYIDGRLWLLGDSHLEGGAFSAFFACGLADPATMATALRALKTRGPTDCGAVVRADGPEDPVPWPHGICDVRLFDMLRLDGTQLSLSPRPVFDAMPDGVFGPRTGGRPSKLGDPVAEFEHRKAQGKASPDLQTEITAIHRILHDRYGGKAKTRKMVTAAVQPEHAAWSTQHGTGR